MARCHLVEGNTAGDKSEVASKRGPSRQCQGTVQNMHQYQNCDAWPQPCTDLGSSRDIDKVGENEE